MFVVHVAANFVLICSILVSIHVTDMAEGIAVFRLIATIAALVDLSAKVLSRQQDFASKFSDFSESFRSLWIRLPLLTATLDNI